MPSDRAASLALRPSALLAVGRRLAPPGLLPPAAVARLARIPTELPSVGLVGAFEVRLEDDDAPIDFEVCLRGTPAVRHELRAWLTGAAAAALAARSAAWARVTRFLAAWADPSSPLAQAVPIVWLEFDAPMDTGEPEPFVVMTLDRDCFHPDGAADREFLTDFLAAVFRLIGDGLDARLEATLRSCVAALPRSAEFAHAAVRPGPDGDGARLVVRLEARTLPETLAAIGWEGSREELRVLLEQMFITRAVQPVNLDLGARIGPRVGIEFHHPTSPVADARWRSFLDALVTSGACSLAQRRRIEAWVLPSARDTSLVRVERDLLVKVVHASGAPLRAKAYLPFGVVLPAMDPVVEARAGEPAPIR